ncbi:hypothetical protein [Halobacillus salinus]|uniref:hypothetical protein n=1 Tax=Halobacillus salinus TaxID=192814 RepID=UPI0019D5690C|nr:hypothetical protein [Halobacillus salinus]
MVGWIILGFMGVVLTTAIVIDRNPNSKQIEEQIEFANENRSKAFEEVDRYYNMN